MSRDNYLLQSRYRILKRTLVGLFSTNITASQLRIFQNLFQNWKAMAKDRTNYYQLTPAQIRTKMKHFRRDTVSWNCYMKDRKERGLDEIELEI